MFGISSSLISSAFGALTGFLFKLRSQNQEILAAERKHNMDMLVAVAKANSKMAEQEIALMEAKVKYERAMHKTDPHRSFARRILAYGMMIGVVFGIPAMVLYADINWFTLHEYTKSSAGFFGIGAYSKQVIEVIMANGVPMVWLTTLLDLFAAIISFYFGGSLAKFRNPYAK